MTRLLTNVSNMISMSLSSSEKNTLLKHQIFFVLLIFLISEYVYITILFNKNYNLRIIDKKDLHRFIAIKVIVTRRRE